MKLLLVARWPVGGIRTYFRYIYTQALFGQYEIHLLSPDLELSAFLQQYFPADRIKFIQSRDDDVDVINVIRKQLKSESYDLIHSHGFSAGALVERAAFWRKIPHIMTAHDVFRDEQFRGIKGIAKKWLLNLTYAKLDGVLTVGRDARDNFKEFMPLVRNSRITNIDHGVNVQAFSSASPRTYRDELSLSPDHRIIGFFGRFMSQKGFIDVIKAMQILREQLPVEQMPLVLTFGWGGFIREDYALIEQRGLADFFRQMPFTDDMPSAIKGVDLVVMPSRWEACGLLAMEVLAAGVPLIGTDCIGLRCVLENTPAKVIPACDAPALANAIMQQFSEGPSAFLQFQPDAIKRFDLVNPALELHNYYQKFEQSARD